MEERLQKIMAHAGIASRRKAEELIAAGRVELNGKKVNELGTKADLAKDIIRVDGKLIHAAQDKVWMVLYKPAGCVTTLSDPEGRMTIAKYIEHVPERVYPVGRLDYDVEGALLITNDGDLAHQLMHPKFGVRRTYLAKVTGHIAGEMGVKLMEKLMKGVRLEDGRAKALDAGLQAHTPKNTWIRLVVAEGRPHLVKRLMEAVGHPVLKLFRADYGGIDVQGMSPGELRELSRAEVDLLKSQAGKKADAKDVDKSVGMPARRHGTTAPAPGGRRAQKRRASGARRS
ncbi:MAG: rRNA pseudouridine synthase [Deltaproteobacteria bacterium]|nr:rRNA pseudouridine synthase [Deltaproteobacteria bacterium]